MTPTSTTGRKRTPLTAPLGRDNPIAGPDGDTCLSTASPPDGIGRRLHFKNMYLPDYEDPNDANGDNVYEVTITVQDTEGDYGYEGHPS